MSGPGHVEREEVAATLEARRDLGPTYEPALVDSFAEKVEAAIQARVDARLAEQDRSRRTAEGQDSRQLALGIASLVLGIPVTAVAGGVADLPGVVASWLGIVGVNWAYVAGRRRR